MFPLGIDPQVLRSYVLLYRNPPVVDIDGRAKYADFLEDTAVLLQNHVDQATVLPHLLGPRKIPVHNIQEVGDEEAVSGADYPGDYADSPTGRAAWLIPKLRLLSAAVWVNMQFLCCGRRHQRAERPAAKGQAAQDLKQATWEPQSSSLSTT